jgi:hypothetical protein
VLAEADRGAQTGAAGADDDGVVLVVDDLVRGLGVACSGYRIVRGRGKRVNRLT